MDLQDLLATLDVGESHIHLTVKAAGAQKRGVEDIHTVGGGQDHHALVGAEAVHLHKELVQRLLTLIVTAAETRAALTAHGIDLVNKDDGGGFLLSLNKQVADTAGAHTHIHLHKIRAGDGEELHIGLACHSTGKQSFTGTGRAHQQYALGDMGAEGGVLIGVTEELHDLLQLLLLLVGAGHITEGDLLIALGERADAGLAEVGHLIVDTTAAHAAHEVHQQNEGQNRQHIGQQQLQPVGGVVSVVVIGSDDACIVLLHHQVVEIIVEEIEAIEVADGGTFVLQRGGEGMFNDGETLHLFLHEQLTHLTVGDAVAAAHIAREGQQQHQRQHQ